MTIGRHILIFAFLIFILQGCVRVAGTAEYAKINADGETTVKRASFDTADHLPGNSTPGKITV